MSGFFVFFSRIAEADDECHIFLIECTVMLMGDPVKSAIDRMVFSSMGSAAGGGVVLLGTTSVKSGGFVPLCSSPKNRSRRAAIFFLGAWQCVFDCAQAFASRSSVS